MTTLMIFFLILYAFALLREKDKSYYERALRSIQQEFGQEVIKETPPREVTPEEDLAKKMSEYIKEMKLEESAEVIITEQKIKITLREPILFDLGKSILKPSAREILKGISELLKDIPNPIVVEGHTDNLPIIGGKYRDNWELSTARALSVVRFFTETQKLPPQRFAAIGYGEHQPLYPNTTSRNRALNRRVEINIIRRNR
jgi:chemotaxis protein MotB